MNHGNHETKMKSKLIITTHLLKGEMWIATHLNLMHEQVMKVLDKNFCDFFMEFAGFFAIFGNLMGFLPPWFFAGGGRACNRIQI